MLDLLAETFRIATRTDGVWFRDAPRLREQLEHRHDPDRWFWRGRRWRPADSNLF